MPELINVVLPIFIVIIIGYCIGRFSQIQMDAVVDVAIYIGAPALVFLSLLENKIIIMDAVRIWSASLLIMGGCGAVAWLVFKVLRQQHRGLYVPIAMMNTVYIPFPVVYLAYGSAGLAAASLFSIPNNLLLNSLAVYMMAGKSWRENLREMFKLPVIYAALLGLLFNLLDISIPKMVYDPLHLIGMMLMPLALLILGHNLSRFRLNSLPTTLLASFLRVGVGLGLGLLVAEWLGLSGIYRSVVILDSAMPAATTAVILATKYGNERELVSSVVSLTTLASLVIIPFLLHMLA